MLHKFLRTIRANSQDPYFKQVSLLLHGDGTNGSQNNTFIDSSTNNFSITRNGNTTQGTFNPFSQDAGYWSNFFDGTGGGASNTDSLSIANNTALQMGSSDFTIEGYFYLNNTPTVACRMFEKADQLSNFEILLSLNSASAGSFQYSTNGTSFTTVSLSAAFTLGQWHHIAVTRNSSTLTVWFNGTSIATATISGSIFAGTSTFKIGNSAANTRAFAGNISNFRVVKGTAVYTATFTPPTVPLTAITNTSLLTCQSNRFVDNSSNNFSITRNGDTSVQPFSPFAPTSAYSTSANGGSMYFDGSGDFLSRAFTSTTDGMYIQGTTYTLEAWIYMTSTSGSQVIYGVTDSNQTMYGSVFLYSNAGVLTADIRPTTGGANVTISGGTIIANTWNHVAFSTNAGSGRLFLNGTQVGSTTSVSAATFTPVGAALGRVANGITSGITDFTGYIYNLRIVQSTALYTANFTPPTSPLTAITNTSLLLSGTNAGIFDNAMKNNLATVGNAQVSTSVTKFGTGSMSFDGSGDYLTAANSSLFSFGTGDYTVEYWVYPASFIGQPTMFDTRLSGGSVNGYSDFFTTAGLFRLYIGNTIIYTSSTTISTNTWTHIAVSRSGTSLRVFINGVQDGSTVTNSTNMTDNACLVGLNRSLNAPLNGYIDDLRVTKGVARYTANFTPPSAPYPNS